VFCPPKTFLPSDRLAEVSQNEGRRQKNCKGEESTAKMTASALVKDGKSVQKHRKLKAQTCMHVPSRPTEANNNHHVIAIIQANLRWPVSPIKFYCPNVHTSAFGLGRRRSSSAQQCYLCCLHTVLRPAVNKI